MSDYEKWLCDTIGRSLDDLITDEAMLAGSKLGLMMSLVSLIEAEKEKARIAESKLWQEAVAVVRSCYPENVPSGPPDMRPRLTVERAVEALRRERDGEGESQVG